MRRTKRKHSPRKQRPAAPHCPRCDRSSIRSGMVEGQQRWKCKSCAYQFTRTEPRGRPMWQKSLVVFLYGHGLSMHRIAAIFHVQPSTILKWVRSYAKDHHPKPGKGAIALMGMEEMQQHLKKVGGRKSKMLCIAIGDDTFKKSLGITINHR